MTFTALPTTVVMSNPTLTLLEKVRAGTIDVEAAMKEIGKKELTYKISVKGAVSFYGLRRMPITLYIQELESIISTFNSAEFQEFITENEARLSRK